MGPGSKLRLLAKLRLSIEVLVAVAAIMLLAASLISPVWIERTLGAAPDNGDGGVEWGIALVAAAVSLTLSWLARRDWRALAAADRATAAGGSR